VSGIIELEIGIIVSFISFAVTGFWCSCVAVIVSMVGFVIFDVMAVIDALVFVLVVIIGVIFGGYGILI